MSRSRYVFLALSILVLYYLSSTRSCFNRTSATINAQLRHSRDRRLLLLDGEQCQAAFPSLTKEIDDALKAGPFKFKRAVDDYSGQTHGRIQNGKVSVFVKCGEERNADVFGRVALYHCCQ